MATKRDLFPFSECRICSGKATGVHYGVSTCDGCKGFFKRCITDHKTFTCYLGNNCAITQDSRNACKACRIRLCLESGMSMDAIRMGRKSNLEKECARKQIHEKEWSSAQNMVQGMKDEFEAISVEQREPDNVKSSSRSSPTKKAPVSPGHQEKSSQDQAVSTSQTSEKSAEGESWTSITRDSDQAENLQDGKTTTKLTPEAENSERSRKDFTYHLPSEHSGDIADDHLSQGDIMTGATCGAGDAHLSGTPDLTFSFDEDQPAVRQKVSTHPSSLSMAVSQTSRYLHVGEDTTKADGDKPTICDPLVLKPMAPEGNVESKPVDESSSKKNVPSSDQTAMQMCGSQSSIMVMSSTSDGNKESPAHPNTVDLKKTSTPLCIRWSWCSEEEINLSTKYFGEQDDREEKNAQKAEERSQDNPSTRPKSAQYKTGADVGGNSMLETQISSDCKQVLPCPPYSSTNSDGGRIEKTIKSLEEALDVLLGPVYERRQLLKDYRDGKVTLTTTTVKKEEMAKFWPDFIIDLEEEKQRVIAFTTKLPGFGSLCRDDQVKLVKKSFPEIQLLTTCEFNGKRKNSSYVLNKSQIFAKDTMYSVIGNDKVVDRILELLDVIDDLKLSTMEMTALSGILATSIDDIEVKDPSSINALNAHYLEVFTHLLRISDRPDKSTMAVDIFYTVLPFLKEVSTHLYKVSESILMEDIIKLSL